jgi:hypothetical protein
VVATVRSYTPGARAVHKTEHLSAVYRSITPVTHYQQVDAATWTQRFKEQLAISIDEVI